MTRVLPDPVRWRRALLGVVRWVTLVDFSNDGGDNWFPVPRFFSGTVSADTTRLWRWATDDLLVGGVKLGDGPLDFTPFHTRFRIRHGIEYRPGDMDLIGMGVYQCTGGAASTVQEHAITVRGKSFESYLIKPRGAFPKPRQFRPSSAQDLTTLLIREVLPKASIAWDRRLDPGQETPLLQSDDDRWKIIDGQTDDASIARAVGGRIYCNGDGGWVAAPPATLADPVTFTSKRGESQFSANRELSNEGVYNVISVKGQSTDGDKPAIGPYAIADVDPYSKTYALKSTDAGGFGLSVRYYSSSMFTRKEQMIKTGQSLLAQSLGLRQGITFSRRYDPSIEPGDVGEVDTDAGPLRVILDALSYPLGGAAGMEGTARTTSALYTGQVAEWSDVEGSAGEDG